MSLLFGLENEPDKDLHDSVMGPAVLPLAIAIGAPWPMMARCNDHDEEGEVMMRVWRGCWVLCCCGLWALPLRAEVKALQKAHFNLRMQKATQQLSNTGQLKITRRGIARAKTLIAEKQAADKQSAAK